jgi:hypothetical protein
MSRPRITVGDLMSASKSSLKTFGSFYEDRLTRYPTRTNVVSSLIIFIIGNLLSQLVDYTTTKGYKFDYIPLLVMSGFGIITAAADSKWFDFLEYNLSKKVGTKLGILHNKIGMSLTKVSIDQFIWSPLIQLFFITFTSVVNGEDIIENIKNKFVKIYLTSLAFWFPTLAIHFLLVPHKYRIIVANLAGLVWSFVLSYLFV